MNLCDLPCLPESGRCGMIPSLRDYQTSFLKKNEDFFLFSLEMRFDSRAMKGSYLSARIPGDMANHIYLTRKSLRHDDWSR